jgi:FKBP-type peptidyl-prolyl cis-trans isomerase 2
MTVEKGNVIIVEYEGRLENGQVFDSSQGKEPLEFEVGAGRVIKGFDEGVLGMEKGQEKEITIESKDAYGDVREDLHKQIPKSSLQFDQEPKEGMGLMLATQDGRQFPTKILKVDNESITIDLNHPLAGKKLIFKVKLVEVK